MAPIDYHTRRSVLTGAAGALLGGLIPHLANTSALSAQFQPDRKELWIRPEAFGAKANGIADDSDALNRFARALGNGVNGLVNGNYLISRSVVIQNKRNFRLLGPGTIRIAAGTPTNEAHSALRFRNSRDFAVEDLIIDGNRTHRRAMEDSGHLIRIDGCRSAKFLNVETRNGTTDGWYIAALATGNGKGGGPAYDEIPADLLFDGCDSTGCYRNGMSIIDGFRIVVRGGTFANAHGHYNDTGRGPCAGIDIEPNRKPNWVKNRVSDLLIEGVVFDRNQGFQLMVSAVDGVSRVIVRDCSFLGNARGAIEVSGEEVRVERPIIDGFGDEPYSNHKSSAKKRAVIDLPAFHQGGTVVINPIFRNIAAASPSLHLIYSHGTGRGGNLFEQVQVDPDCQLGVYLRAPGDKITGDVANDYRRTARVR